ncbi:MAG: N-6 DNA methylase [Hyphomicrobiales bacterium]|nr:N-6 DNA methylase [Hyphomicrobiales bacterium]
MNAVEIEEAVSELAASPFDPGEFPYAFLRAFGNKETTIKRLRSGQSNSSDVPGGVLQRNNIHITVCAEGRVNEAISVLRQSPKTLAAKAKFILATDGVSLEAEDLTSGEPLACAFQEFGKSFGFFLPLAGISAVKEIANNPFDVKATGKLNKLYVELLKDNPDWATESRRPALNQFIARLIFCFFAEDTGIFRPKQFTKTLATMSDGQSGNTHEVMCELFQAMNMKSVDRPAARIKTWADDFPHVNGGMFSGGAECPRFSRIARSYLLSVGSLEWDKINPDIFGSMIQAVADDDERGNLGMHYTSVPNILKVLNPLFLDDLRAQLASAGNNVRKLRNLRRRLSNMRVFDPACGSGNFLVIAYKEMRAIEHEIVVQTRDEPKSVIPLSNFYGIEIKSFAVEIARLALLIAEFQADCIYLSQREARAMVLPLHETGQIHVGNALRREWLEICPPTSAKLAVERDLAGPTGRLALEPFDGSEVRIETYICGNPPYGGSKWQTEDQKEDLRLACSSQIRDWRSLDYVAGWFVKASDYAKHEPSRAAFVSTNSVCQGQMVPVLWPTLLEDRSIVFAHTSFKWSNLASRNAGVIVVIVGLGERTKGTRLLYVGEGADVTVHSVENINAYLIPANDIIVEPRDRPLSDLSSMLFGNMPRDGGHLCLSVDEMRLASSASPNAKRWVKRYMGSEDMINGGVRGCLWIPDEDADLAKSDPFAGPRLKQVELVRAASAAPSTRSFAKRSHRFVQIQGVAKTRTIAVAKVSSERRAYIPATLYDDSTIISDLLFGIYDAPLWNLAIVACRLHLVWIATVCGKLKNDFRYSNTLGWNTFPVPILTDRNKDELSKRAEDILLAREAHFPATLANLYDPEGMPDDLRRAHDANDEAIERIYIGRRFRNDTERLEKLFDLFSRMKVEKNEPKRKTKSVA